MRSIEDIINDIIELGKVNNWFINLDLLTEEDFIFPVGSVIHIDTAGIKAFVEQERTTTDEELENNLREIIEVSIPDSIDYTIVIEVKNTYL